MNAPDKAAEIKAVFTMIFAFFTALWGWLGWVVLIFAISLLLDYVTGSWAARANGEWSSAVARQGLWHKLGEIVALLVAALCDFAIKTLLHQPDIAGMLGAVNYGNYFSVLVAFWYTFTELGSVIENVGKLGAPIPKWLAKGIALLKGKIDDAVPDEMKEKKETDPE